MLDSAHLQEADADYLNRHGLSRHQPALPLYTVADAQRAIAALRPVDFDTATDLPGGCGVQLTPAGHILGAAIVQIRHPGGRLVFSGDLGRYGDPLMPPPGGVAQADHLIVESTYGNRKHSAEQAADALEAVITRTVRRGGTVVIPAFAVGARRRCSTTSGNSSRRGASPATCRCSWTARWPAAPSMSIFGTPVTNACRRPTRGRRSAWRPM